MDIKHHLTEASCSLFRTALHDSQTKAPRTAISWIWPSFLTETSRTFKLLPSNRADDLCFHLAHPNLSYCLHERNFWPYASRANALFAAPSETRLHNRKIFGSVLSFLVSLRIRELACISCSLFACLDENTRSSQWRKAFRIVGRAYERNLASGQTWCMFVVQQSVGWALFTISSEIIFIKAKEFSIDFVSLRRFELRRWGDRCMYLALRRIIRARHGTWRRSRLFYLGIKKKWFSLVGEEFLYLRSEAETESPQQSALCTRFHISFGLSCYPRTKSRAIRYTDFSPVIAETMTKHSSIVSRSYRLNEPFNLRSTVK